MTRGFILIGAHLCAAFFATRADATKFVWTGSGRVTSVTTIQDGAFVAVPSGSIHLDDAISFSLSFTDQRPERGSASDSSNSLYWLHDLSFSGSVGTFAFTGQHFGTDNLQLWNYVWEDAQVVSASRPISNGVPFDGGPAMELQTVSVFAIGPADVRATSDISEMLPLDAFTSRLLALNFYNPDTHLIVSVYATYEGTLSAVPTPEPSAWGMMLAGFGAVGCALRIKRRRIAIAFS